MPAIIEYVDLPSPMDDRGGRYAASVRVDSLGERTLRAELQLAMNGKLARRNFAEIDVKSGVVAVTGAEVIIASKYLVCIGGCGLSHLVKEIMACRRAGATGVEDIIDCLKGKLGALADDLIACAVGCVVTV